ncbi:MAG: cystathionine beta-lyase [Alphaproteobacteria bacterium]|nr:cystathionine beta-lyase [Alphaproteobacteria bacterium]
MKDKTRLIHAGRHPREHIGAVNVPVYRASTILHPTMADLEGATLRYGYGRRGTPTTRGLEELVCALEGGSRTVLTPSGLSACTAALLAVLDAGDHLLMTDTVYGPTRAFCRGPLARFGIETSCYPATATAAELEALIRPNTRALYLESPGSGTFEVQDVPALAAAARARGLAVLMDNTWATPLYCKPLALGADISIAAATKYFVGHADVLIGTITANEAYAKRLLALHGAMGLYVSGDDAYLTQRGMRTMDVRLARHQETALKMAGWLKARPEVARVLYPALDDDPGHSLWKRDFTGASGLFGVELNPAPKAAVAAMLDGYELFGMGWSWGGYESLCVPTKIERTEGGYRPAGPLLRYHAGLEDADDLIADLAAGFERFNAKL